MGEIGAILPLNPVLQPGKTTEVRPTLDYTDLNEYIAGTSDRENNEICAESLREWRRYYGMYLGDLSKAYMRVHVSPELWRFQVLRWRDQDYVLTRLGFGLRSAPRMLKRIMDSILEKEAVAAYRDDLCAGARGPEEREAAKGRLQSALKTLEQAGFPSKGIVSVFPGELAEPVRILGLQVYSGEDGELHWRRKAHLEEPGELRTLRQLAGCVGKIAPGNLPILRWARPYAQILRSMIGREAGSLWKAEPSEELVAMVQEFVGMLLREDPAEGRWCSTLPKAVRKQWTLCCDASQVAMGATLIAGDEIDRSYAVEDYCWLNKKPRQINVLETEAVLKGFTEAMHHVRSEDEVTIVVDSKTAFSWIQKALGGDLLRCQSMSGPLLIRRLSIIHDLAENIRSVKVRWVPSEQNPADELTRVNSRWVARLRQYSNFDWDEAPEERVVIAAVVGEGKTRDKEMIQRWQQEEQIALGEEGEMINGVYCRRHGSRRGVYLPIIPAAKVKEYVLIRHRELGHMGVGGLWRSLREEASFPDGNLADQIRNVIAECDDCARRRSVAYAPGPGTTWGRYPWDELFIDCLTLPSSGMKGLIVAVDGFSRFAEVKAVPAFSATEVVRFLEELAARFGAPRVLRMDRGREFDNALVQGWCSRMDTTRQFSSVANPRSQGVVERLNRTLLELMRSLNADELTTWENTYVRAVALYNSRSHHALHGHSPREVFMGRREIRAGEQIVESESETRALDEWAAMYRPLEFEYEEFEWQPKFKPQAPVFARKLQPKDQHHFEEAKVVAIGTNGSYVIETTNGNTKVVHERNLRARSGKEGPESPTEGPESPIEGPESPGLASENELQLLHVSPQPEKNFETPNSENGEFSPVEEPRRSARRPKPIVRFDL